jgi:hypothetical protein
MDKVSGRIRELVVRQVEERGIVVWYDPDKCYGSLVQNLALPGTEVLSYTDGFFRLRHQLEPYLEYVTNEGKPRDNCGIPPKLVVYVPMERSQTSNALVEAETAGVVLEPGAEAPERNTRLRVQAESYFMEAAPEKASHLARQVDEGLLSLEDLDRIAEEVGNIGSGALKLVFGAISPVEMIIEFASHDGKDAKLKEKKALSELLALIHSELGLDCGAPATVADARNALRRLILLGELAASVPAEHLPPALGSVKVPESPIQLDSLQHLCTAWRNRVDYREAYAEAANDLESAAGIAHMEFGSWDLEKIETFACLETRLLLHAEKLLLDGQGSEALRLAKARKGSFWSREQPPFSLRWSALELASRFVDCAKGVRETLKQLHPNAPEMVKAYTQFSEPWMTADRLHRTWESKLLNIDPEEAGGAAEFEQLMAKVRLDYASLVDDLCRVFVHELETGSFEIKGVRNQDRIFADSVAPAIQEGRKSAYLLVDALRYEMGVELVDGLGEDFEITVEPALATLPSITSVGMAALMPTAEKGIEIAAVSGKAGVVLDGQTLKDRQSRLEFFAAKVGKGFVALKLAEVLKMGAKRKKEVASANLIVVTSQEIDRLGEEGDDQADTRRWMDEMLEQLRRAIRVLARLGVEQFIITSDHGYFFADSLDPGMLMDPPGGTTVELHPRVWIGQGGQAADGYLRVKASQLELGGPLEFAFPRGYSCFKVKGGVGAYFHGGISLQEMVIPVAVLKSKAAKPAGAPKVRVTLEFSKSAITNRFFSVVACLKEEGLFGPGEVRVRAVLESGKTEAGFCAMAAYGYEEGTKEITLRENQPNALTFMLSGESKLEKVTVRLLDCHTQLELASLADVPVKLVI